MRNDFSRPPALWTPASVPNARDFTIWDKAQYQGIDGDNGGTWSPTTPIGIGGNGVQLSAPSVMGGGFRTQQGGRFVLGTADFPAFRPSPVTRNVVFPLRGITGSTGIQFRGPASGAVSNLVVPGAIITGWTDPMASTLYLPVNPRWVHDGATLTSIKITAFLASTPGAAPTVIQHIGLIDGFTGAGVDYGWPTNVWLPTHAYPSGSIVVPSTPTNQNGSAFYTAGLTSGGTEPTWNTSGSTTDGSGTWTAVGGGTLVMPGPFTTTALYAQGTSYTMSLFPLPPALPTVTGLVMDKSHPYTLYIVQDLNDWIYTSCEFGYTAINDFRFE